MAYIVDFTTVSTVGLDSCPHAAKLAGLRANEARYFSTKYGITFTTQSAAKASKLVTYVARVLKEERDIVIASPALEASEVIVDGIRWTHVFYESMDVPDELVARFKFARQKSKLAGEIRGTFFVIKGTY